MYAAACYLHRRIEEILLVVAERLSHSLRVVRHEDAGIMELPFVLLYHDRCVEGFDSHVVGLRCDAGYERNLVELESERLYQYACLQLCNLCKLQSAEPFLELDKIDLVAVLTQIIADAHDVCEVQTVGKDGLCGLYDDVQKV